MQQEPFEIPHSIVLDTKQGDWKPFTPRDTTIVYRINEGWLIKFRHFSGGASILTAQTMTFIPDRDHEWKPEDHNTPWERVCQKKNPNFNEFVDRLKVRNGWIYKDSFVSKGVGLSLSMVFVEE